jgi:phenylalanyl-tRNA synthetase alpha chain
MEENLARLESEAPGQVEAAKDVQELEAVRVRLLGKKGELTGVLRGLNELSDDKKREVGQRANVLRDKLSGMLEARKKELAAKSLDAALGEGLDVTLPGAPLARGTMHPVSRTIQDVATFFHGLGYEVVDGPELESDFYNFEALNMPDYHPARDAQDSFYADASRAGLPPSGKEWLLRTHTSNVQVHVMQKRQPPMRVIAPGKVYRRDNDATHSPMFHQVEGFMVDTDVTFGNLKAVLTQFVRHMFGEERKLRLRPSFFPFTEPSAEVDMSCPFCKRLEGEASDCRVCKGGWLEIGGSGMIHPNVLRATGQDPEKYSGFAFGFGIERIAMLRYRIPNIRWMFENDVRFLKQF